VKSSRLREPFLTTPLTQSEVDLMSPHICLQGPAQTSSGSTLLGHHTCYHW
jgi:hypothetical protein